MILDKPGDGKTIIFVVLTVEKPGIIRGQLEVTNEVVIDKLLHQVLYTSGPWVEAIVYIEEEDGTTVGSFRIRHGDDRGPRPISRSANLPHVGDQR